LRLRKFNVVRTIHNTSLWETRPRLGRFSEAGYENDLIISVSQDALSAYRDLRQRFGLTPAAHQTVVSGSVANISEEDTYCRENLADRFGANTEKVLLCFAGRLVEQKGFDILIDAVSGLESEFREKVEIHVFTAGHGLKDYQDRVFAQNLPFHFHQPIAHIARYFSAFDGILMPSRWEGYGRVAAEGFLAGTPVLAADAPGLREIFPPGWPLKFPINNPAALRGALRDLLNGYHDLDELGRAAKEWAQSAFSVDREVDEYDVAFAEYLEILQN